MKKVISLVIVLFLLNPLHMDSMPVDNKTEFVSKNKRFSNIENMTHIWNYFKNQGIDENIIAGVMGNMSIESNFSSSIRNKSGHAGYVQMNRTLQKLIVSKYGSFNKDTQLLHLSNWLLCKETGKLAYMQDNFKLADNSTPEKAARNFAKYYERPKSKNYSNRQQMARIIYEKFKEN
jgi:hypothetical protein